MDSDHLGYATFGKFSDGDGAVDPNVQAVPTATQKEAIPTSESQPMDTFKPSRKVRTAPGGTSSGLFDVDDEEADDALSRAPPDERSKVQARRVLVCAYHLRFYNIVYRHRQMKLIQP